MTDERKLIARLEAAGTKELAEIIARPSPDEERALRAHLGDDRFDRMRELVLQSSLTRAERTVLGNVVVLHGIMGGELTYYRTDAEPERVWIKIFRLITGEFSRFVMDDRGASEFRIQATGILKRFYGEQLLSLMQNWNTHAFWFDWRLSVWDMADELERKIHKWFGDTAPVHLVAHSMGGLVARAFIKKYPERWKRMWDATSGGKKGGRLVMLGTPNYGSFAIPQLLMGLNDVMKKLALVDVRHNMQDLLNVAKTFIGSYQMLPSPLVMPEIERLYEAATYAPVEPPPSRLAEAREFHKELHPVVDPDRMIYVAGYNKPTFSGIRNWHELHSTEGYDVTRRGDGTVPHKLGLLQPTDGRTAPTFYIEEEHGSLPGNRTVLAALDDLLEKGATKRLAREISADLRGEEDEAMKQQVRADLLQQREGEEARLRELLMPLQAAARARGGDLQEPDVISEKETELENLLTRGFAGVAAEPAAAPAGPTTAPVPPPASVAIPKIRIRLLHMEIENVGQSATEGESPIDAIAVGHYVDVRPQAAEKALDKAISKGLGGGAVATAAAAPHQEPDLLLTEFTQRGVIRGELGQLFLMNDPRLSKEDRSAGRERLIVVAGMGHPGRFGAPELAVLARELTWSLGRLGKRHLASVLIGSGNGNLGIRDAVGGWLEGVKRALSGSAPDATHHLGQITFVETEARKVLRMSKAFSAEKKRLQGELEVDLVLLKKEEEEDLKARAQKEYERERLEQEKKEDEEFQDKLKSEVPTRLTVELENDVYRFSAITETASVPERKIPLDPKLVNDANDELAAQRDKAKQGDLGVFLQKLLIPEDLRPVLSSNAPLVVTCDSTVARIHWEMLVQPERAADSLAAGSNPTFLGIHRGFTRQLRTVFAPPPGPPPPFKRVLRVLIVGDPAADAPLPGAQEEAILVRDLFKKFEQQEQGKRVSAVEVVPLLGPSQATRTRVMQELMLKPYDVLHYAGHCKYDKEKPSASGWIFTGGDRLSAHELSRVDRIPKFVFSNACESGITPDRSEKRSAGLAPSFAEAFFARGVQNFVCTAWPVNDRAALDFARRLYSCLLGLDDRNPEPMHVAMREARGVIQPLDYGVRTWGAYQHYGDPYFRLVR